MNEPLIYALTALLGVSAGLGFGSASTGAFRWAGRAAGVLVTAVVVIAGLILGAQAVWIGPIFLLASFVTTVMVGAVVRRDEPMFLAASFWQRVLLVSRGTKSEPIDAGAAAGRSHARIDAS